MNNLKKVKEMYLCELTKETIEGAHEEMECLVLFMVVASLVLHSYGVAYLIGGGPISGVQDHSSRVCSCALGW